MQLQTTPPTLQRIKQVIQRTGVSRSMLYSLMARGEFPKPVKISARAVAWDSHAVTAWIESRLLQQTSLSA
jgi:prophage regulatory protein